MSLVIVCSICSREKNTNICLLPARKRYLGSHVSIIKTKADKMKLPFFFLSGWYGFIPAEEEIPYYDYLLTINRVEDLAIKIADQLKRYDVKEIHFFTKNKPGWQLYEEALVQAVESLRITLNIHHLSEDD